MGVEFQLLRTHINVPGVTQVELPSLSITRPRILERDRIMNCEKYQSCEFKKNGVTNFVTHSRIHLRLNEAWRHWGYLYPTWERFCFVFFFFFAEPNSLLGNQTYDLILGESQMVTNRPSRPDYTVNVGCNHTTGIVGIFSTLLCYLCLIFLFYLFRCCPVCYVDSEIRFLQFPTLSLFYYHRSHRCTLNCTML